MLHRRSLQTLHENSYIQLCSSILFGIHFSFQVARGEKDIAAHRNKSISSKSILAVYICFVSASKRHYLLFVPFSLHMLLMNFSSNQSELLNQTTTAQENLFKSMKPVWNVYFKKHQPLLAKKE